MIFKQRYQFPNRQACSFKKKVGFAIFFYLLAKRCTFNLQNFDFPNPVSDGIGTKSERQGSHVTRKISEVHVYFMKREDFVSLSVSRSSFLEAVRLFRQFIILLNTTLRTSYMKSYLFEKMIICTLCFAPDTELLLL